MTRKKKLDQLKLLMNEELHRAEKENILQDKLKRKIQRTLKIDKSSPKASPRSSNIDLIPLDLRESVMLSNSVEENMFDFHQRKSKEIRRLQYIAKLKEEGAKTERSSRRKKFKTRKKQIGPRDQLVKKIDVDLVENGEDEVFKETAVKVFQGKNDHEKIYEEYKEEREKLAKKLSFEESQEKSEKYRSEKEERSLRQLDDMLNKELEKIKGERKIKGNMEKESGEEFGMDLDRLEEEVGLEGLVCERKESERTKTSAAAYNSDLLYFKEFQKTGKKSTAKKLNEVARRVKQQRGIENEHSQKEIEENDEINRNPEIALNFSKTQTISTKTEQVPRQKRIPSLKQKREESNLKKKRRSKNERRKTKNQMNEIWKKLEDIQTMCENSRSRTPKKKKELRQRRKKSRVKKNTIKFDRSPISRKRLKNKAKRSYIGRYEERKESKLVDGLKEQMMEELRKQSEGTKQQKGKFYKGKKYKGKFDEGG
jgi:hypothetical protein